MTCLNDTLSSKNLNLMNIKMLLGVSSSRMDHLQDDNENIDQDGDYQDNDNNDHLLVLKIGNGEVVN